MEGCLGFEQNIIDGSLDCTFMNLAHTAPILAPI